MQILSEKHQNTGVHGGDPLYDMAYDEACVEIAKRCRDRISNGDDILENRALLAFVLGDDKETDRLLGLARRRNAFGIRPVMSSVKSSHVPVQDMTCACGLGCDS